MNEVESGRHESAPARSIPGREREPDPRDGTEQAERAFPALGAERFQVDERELGDLLHLLGGVAENLAFIDVEDRPRGNWADLYRHPDLLVLVEIAAFGSDRPRSVGLPSAGPRDAEGLAGEILGRARRMDRWLAVLRRSDHPAATALFVHLEGMVRTELAPALHAALELLDPGIEPTEGDPSEGGGETRSETGGFHPAWGLGKGGPPRARSPRSALPASPRDRQEHLERASHALRNAMGHLGQAGRTALAEVRRSGRNDPGVGLLMAFLELFLQVRADLNRFPARRMDFYYHRFLGMRPHPRVPDRAHLRLRPTAGFAVALVPGGTGFSAGRDVDRSELVFTLPEPFLATDAEVVELRGIQYEQDPLISPERELGFVTRIVGGIASDPSPRVREGEPTPAFSTSRRGNPYSADETPVGFAVASPILDLAEGTRRIVCDVELGAPVREPHLTLDQAIEALHELPIGDAGEFFRGFGHIFARALLGGAGTRPDDREPGWCTAEQRDSIREAAHRALPSEGDAGLRVVEDVLDRDALVLFHALFRSALVVRFTGAEGWTDVGGVHVSPLPQAPGRAGLRIEMTLGPDVGPVVSYRPELHGPFHPGRLPLLSFRVNPRALFFPFSLFDTLRLERIGIEVEVTGVADLVVQNGLGPLDPSKPFQPFGPLPTRDSYLVVGSHEAARKRLTRATLHVEWGDLPDTPGGFRRHYAPYGLGVTNDAFSVSVSFLNDGRWEPAEPGERTTVPLFRSDARDGRVAPGIALPLRPIELLRPLKEGVAPRDFAFLPRARHGHVRLSLEASDATFGHREYPGLLTEALSHNARRRKAEPVPDPPYTPVIKRLTLDYTARATLRPGTARDAWSAASGGRILHEHPYGWEDLTAAPDEGVFSLMPGRPEVPDRTGRLRGYEGYLFIGLTGTRIAGPLSLLFHLRHDAAEDPSGAHPGVTWFLLESNRWRAIPPSQVLGDTTDGFQRSGIVTLDVPEEIDLGNTILPGDRYWLAVGANHPLRSLAHRLLSVSTGGVEVVWEDRGNPRPGIEVGLPAGTIRGPASAVPGLGQVLQVGESFGGRPAEDEGRLVTRTAERLRHKERAVSAWDYERLILEQFVEVHRVKAFPSTDPRRAGPAPGQVLVVVVPRLVRREDDRTLTPRFSSGELMRMQDFLRSRASGFAGIRVVNPIYEQVQVRCRVKLTRGLRAGHLLREINDALVDHISPWRPGGFGTKFGWRIHRKEIEARIRELPFVELVTAFSMLQITLDEDGRYSLGDTARPEDRIVSAESGAARPGHLALETEALAALPSSSEHEVSARYPWSLAVPTREHFIQTTPRDLDVPAAVTGLGDLQIGTTFILGAGRRNG